MDVQRHHQLALATAIDCRVSRHTIELLSDLIEPVIFENIALPANGFNGKEAKLPATGDHNQGFLDSFVNRPFRICARGGFLSPGTRAQSNELRITVFIPKKHFQSNASVMFTPTSGHPRRCFHHHCLPFSSTKTTSFPLYVDLRAQKNQ